MFPSTFFGLFPPFPRDYRAFIAMSFDEKFKKRYEEVIAPAIRSIEINGVTLEPFRVDLRMFSDSILTEILDGISKCRVVVADISLLGELNGKPIRNANVMYEIGLAHAIRLPEETIILRSDDSPLLFDIANVRVLRYDPDESPDQARRIIGQAVVQSLKEVDLKKHLSVKKVLEGLTYEDWQVLIEASAQPFISHPTIKTVRNVLQSSQRILAISKLLEYGLLRAEMTKVSRELIDRADEIAASNLLKYTITEFGQAVMHESALASGMTEPDVKD